MSGFVKLFGSILDSTVWREDHATRLLWVTMLAMADADGVVEASIPGLADRARITLQECEHALERLASPDRYSRTPDHDGRRIQEIDGGWLLLNHQRYRERRTPVAERVARHRQRKSALQCNDVTPDQKQIRSETEAETEAENTHSLRSPVGVPRPKQSGNVSPPTSEQGGPTSDADSFELQPAPSPLPKSKSPVPRAPRSPRAKPKSASDPRVEQVLGAIDAELVAAGRKPLRPSLRTPTAIATLLEQGEPVEDLLLAVKLRAAQCREAGSWRYFDATAPFSLPRGTRPGGWAWTVRQIEEHREAPPVTAPRSGWVTPEQARAEAEKRWGVGK